MIASLTCPSLSDLLGAHCLDYHTKGRGTSLRWTGEGGDATKVPIKGLLQRETPGQLCGEAYLVQDVLVWAGLRWADLCWSGEAGLGWAIGLGRLHWLRQDSLALV